MTQTEKMLNAPVKKLVITLAIPTIISMLISNIYNLVDTAFIGTLGTSASGAVGVVFGYMAIIQACGFMFGQGSGILMSRRLGANNQEGAKEAASTGFYTSTTMGILLAVITLIFIDPIINILGSTPTIAPYAKTYIHFILIAAPAMTASFALNNLLRFEGRAKLGMIGLLTGSILNICGDALFIFVFKMGIAGAGLSTAISQYIGLFILLLPYLRHKTIVGLNPKKISKTAKTYGTIVMTGMPSLIRQGLSSIATIVLNSLAGGYSDAAVSAMSIANRVSFLALGICLGIGQGFQPISGFSHGAKKYRRLRDAFEFTFVTAECVMFVLLGIIYCFAPELVQLFRDDPEVIRIGERALRLLCIGMLLLPGTSVSEMLFQSTGSTVIASVIALLKNGIIFIPVLIILESIRGLAGIQEAQPLAYMIAYIPAYSCLIAYMRKLPKEDFVEA